MQINHYSVRLISSDGVVKDGEPIAALAHITEARVRKVVSLRDQRSEENVLLTKTHTEDV